MTTYVYAIVGSGHPARLDDLRGIGDPAEELRVLPVGPLAVVASDAPDGLRAKRRDLLAHQRVMDRLLQDGAVLPMRFGLVAPDDGQVVSAVSGDADRYTARLAELDGCREYNLKVTRAEDDLLRQILTDLPEARRLNELTRADPADHARKVKLGEVLAGEARARQETDAREIAAALEPRAVRRSDAKPTGSYFLNASFLVNSRKAEEFTRAVEEEARRRGDSYGFTLSGPLPPYSFV